MKKQRKPIILVLLLAALLGGAAIMNKPQTSPQDMQKQGQEAPPDKKEAVAGDVNKQMADAKPQMPPKPHRHPGMPGGDGPSILKPNIAPYKPKPSDSATSTQWWQDQSARNTSSTK